MEYNPHQQQSGHEYKPNVDVEAWLQQYHTREQTRQEQQKVSRVRRAVVAGAGLLALGIGAGVVATTGVFEQGPAEAPHELELAGTLNMSELSQQLKPADIEAAKQTGSKEFGIPVVPLSEYQAARGLKNDDGVEMRQVSKASVPPAFQEKLDTVVAANADVLNYLVNTENVSTIRFSVALNPSDLKDLEDGDMRFTAPFVNENGQAEPGAITYVLPADKEVSVEVAATMLSHEEEHAVQLPLDVVRKDDNVKTHVNVLAYEQPTDNEAYAEDLAAMRTAAVDAAEADPKVQAAAEDIIAVNQGINTPVARAETKIARSILDGTFDTLQPTKENPSKASEGIEGNFLQEGRINRPSFVETFDSGLSEADKPTEAQLAVMEHVDKVFTNAIDHSPDSPFALLEESTYLDGSEALGHAWGNFNEAAASSINVVKNFPQQVAIRIKQLPVGAKKATLSFLKRLSSDRSKAIAQHPSETTTGQDIEDKISSIEPEAA